MSQTREQVLEIDHLGAQGDGVALDGEGSVYVAGALPGDRVRVRITGKRGQGRAADLIGYETRQPRAEPICRHVDDCGGCVAQHIPEDLYRDWQQSRILGDLQRQH